MNYINTHTIHLLVAFLIYCTVMGIYEWRHRDKRVRPSIRRKKPSRK